MSVNKLKPGVRLLTVPGILMLIGTAGVGLYFWLANRPTDPVPVSLVSVEKGDLESTINESGTVELRGQKTLKSPTEGAVETVLVKPGQRVQAGQTLLTLRYPERQTALANQQLLIRQQQITVEQNRQRVLDAQEKLAIEGRKLKNLVDLVSQGAITQQLFQDQEDRVRTTRIALREAESTVSLSTVELERSQLERQRIVQQLQNSIITAPLDAIVLDVKVKDGEGVELRTELLTLGDPNQEYVRLRLSTLDVERIQPNQPARISIIGPNPEIYSGRIESLYPQANFPEQPKQGSNNRQSEQATVPAVVKLNKPTNKLIPGIQVNVEIVLAQQKNVVTLNPEAVQRATESPFVWVLDSGKAQKRPIKTGIEGLLGVEVTSGLTPGEQVIIPPAEPPLSPGMPVVAEKKS